MNHTPKFQLKLNEESEIDFKLSIEGSVSDQDMAKPIFRFVMTENSSDRGWVFPVKTKYKGSDIFTVKIPALNENAKEDTPYSGRLEVIMGNLIMIPTEVLLEFKRPFSVKAEIKSEMIEASEAQPTPQPKQKTTKPIEKKVDTLEEDIDAVIAIAKPEKPRLPTNSPKPTPTNIPTTPPKVQNPVLFNNVMFLEENKKSVNKTPVQATKLKVEQSPAEREQIKNKLKNMFKSALK